MQTVQKRPNRTERRDAELAKTTGGGSRRRSPVHRRAGEDGEAERIGTATSGGILGCYDNKVSICGSGGDEQTLPNEDTAERPSAPKVPAELSHEEATHSGNESGIRNATGSLELREGMQKRSSLVITE